MQRRMRRTAASAAAVSYRAAQSMQRTVITGIVTP
jgi:hypothetical protein